MIRRKGLAMAGRVAPTRPVWGKTFPVPSHNALYTGLPVRRAFAGRAAAFVVQFFGLAQVILELGVKSLHKSAEGMQGIALNALLIVPPTPIVFHLWRPPILKDNARRLMVPKALRNISNLTPRNPTR